MLKNCPKGLMTYRSKPQCREHLQNGLKQVIQSTKRSERLYIRTDFGNDRRDRGQETKRQGKETGDGSVS